MAWPEQLLVELNLGDGDLVEPRRAGGIGGLDDVDDVLDERVVERGKDFVRGLSRDHIQERPDQRIILKSVPARAAAAEHDREVNQPSQQRRAPFPPCPRHLRFLVHEAR